MSRISILGRARRRVRLDAEGTGVRDRARKEGSVVDDEAAVLDRRLRWWFNAAAKRGESYQPRH
jgi:hypothetical protein